MHDNTEYVLESLRAGAHGYLLKDSAAAELRGAIRAVCRGESFFSPPGRQPSVARQSGASRINHHALDQLTARERQVLIGVARGHTNKEIATELGISHRTVETSSRKPDAKAGGPHRGGADPVRDRGRSGADRTE